MQWVPSPAPKPEIEGALLAAKHYPGVKVLLVGPEKQLRRSWPGTRLLRMDVEVVNATEVITMHEKPVQAVGAEPQHAGWPASGQR